MKDSYATAFRSMQDSLLRGPGQLSPTTRQALALGTEVPEPLGAYAQKLRRHAYRVTDDDILALRRAGFSEDQIFEATLAVALGSASICIDAGLRALKTVESGEREHNATS